MISKNKNKKQIFMKFLSKLKNLIKVYQKKIKRVLYYQVLIKNNFNVKHLL